MYSSKVTLSRFGMIDWLDSTLLPYYNRYQLPLVRYLGHRVLFMIIDEHTGIAS